MVSSRPAVDDLSVQSARLASLTLEIPDNSDDESESSIPLSPSTDATTPTTDTHSPLSPFDASPKAVNASNSQSASELAREAESSPRRTRLNREREFRRNRFGSSSSRISYQRLQSPDRFLPDRQFQDTVTESFRLSEWPTQRPVRAGFARRLQGSSPFGPTNNTIVPITPPRRDSSLPRVFSPRHLPHRISTSVLEMGYAQTVPSRIPRPSGAAGGELVVRTDPSVAIPDGRGGYLGSGTVAPMHIAGFTAPRTLERDLHEHEIRISLALDVDRTSRVLNFSSPSPPSSPGSDIRSPVDRDNSPTWKDNAWTTGGDRTGKSMSFFGCRGNGAGLSLYCAYSSVSVIPGIKHADTRLRRMSNKAQSDQAQDFAKAIPRPRRSSAPGRLLLFHPRLLLHSSATCCRVGQSRLSLVRNQWRETTSVS
jgi:hypothetical protein